ncbi:hypothetical protein PRNP1_014518 [Phytophthora ramorum]
MHTFTMSRSTIDNIWKLRSYPKALTAPRQPYPKRSRRFTVAELGQIVAAVPLCKRQTIRALAEATNISRSTLHDYLKVKSFRRVISRVKPTLTSDHKNQRLSFALNHVRRPIAVRWKDVFSGRLAATAYCYSTTCSGLSPSASETEIGKLRLNINFKYTRRSDVRTHRSTISMDSLLTFEFTSSSSSISQQNVPRMTIMAAQVVLLFPEDVPQEANSQLAAPTYAEIFDDSEPERVCVRTLVTSNEDDSQPQWEAWLPRSIAFRRLVWSAEPSSGGAGNLLWRAVVLPGPSGPIYGQVIEYKGSTVSIRSMSGITSAPAATVDKIAPVIAVLLFKAKLTRRARADISSAHGLILDRLLGQNGTTATRSVRQLLAGIVPIASLPRPSDNILWRCPRTGSDKTCTIEHVVNFGYYHDGEKVPPPSVRLGDNFCDEPVHSPPRHEARQETTSGTSTRDDTTDSAPLAELLDTLDQAEDTQYPRFARSQLHEHEETCSTPDDETYARPVLSDTTARNGTAPSAPVRIMSVLANYPDLLETYASQLQQLGSERKRPRLHAISDSVPVVTRYEDAAERRHNFRPSQGQQAVHEAITASEHRGKSPALFVEYVRSSKFLPHPAILSRLYDFQFGVCGLSVLHLQRFDLTARLEHAGSNSVNLRNFSVKVALPSLPTNPSHSSLCNSLSILGTYAEEFFDAPTRRLLTSAKSFAEELTDYAPWSPDEVKAIAFWFSNVLGAYRRAVESDISQGRSTRSELTGRFCMQDAELNGMLLKLSRGRDQGIRRGKRDTHEPQLDASDRPQYRGNRPNGRQASRRQVPIAVTQAAPRLNGKQLCLRYISIKGCPSKAPDRCTYEFLGHFNPETLDPVVREYVVEKYGGLSSEMSDRV